MRYVCTSSHDHGAKVLAVETASLHAEDHTGCDAFLVAVILKVLNPARRRVVERAPVNAVVCVPNSKHTRLSTKEQVPAATGDRRIYPAVIIDDHSVIDATRLCSLKVATLKPP